MKIPCAAAAILVAATATPAGAQGEPPDRQANVIVYGSDPCPAPADPEEIVVCARQPEEERYRIPEPLRRSSRPPETSWGTQAAQLDEAQRDSRPDSCSVVGSFGQTGCRQQMLRDWAAERRTRPRQ